MLARIRSVVVVSDAPPAAPSFPPCRKRRGRKGALGRVLVRPAAEFRQESMFQASFHTIVTSRASYYAPPDTESIRFDTSCRRMTAVNRRCGGDPDGFHHLARHFVGARRCSARCSDEISTSGRSRALPLQGAPHGFPYEGKAMWVHCTKGSPLRGAVSEAD